MAVTNELLCNFRVTGINMKSTGSTTLVDAKTGKYFEPVQLVVRRTTVTGAGSEAAWNVGTNSTAFDNVFSGRSLSIVTTDLMLFFKPDNVVDSGGIAVDIGTNPIKLNITGASTRTTDVASFILQGFVV